MTTNPEKRKNLLIGNWKMYKTVAEARKFAEELGMKSGVLLESCEYGICAPFTTLHVLRVMLPALVKMGAQNVYFEAEGAYTGEISAPMLAEIGTHFVLVGHSERRTVFAESDTWIQKKVHAVVEQKMVPVLCVGESLAERESGKTAAKVAQQVQNGLALLTAQQVAHSVIAYEPIWAIGSGKTASFQDAEEVASGIRGGLSEQYGSAIANCVRILYGGSVKPENIASFVQQSNIDGALVGGASLEASSFAQMAEAIGGESV